MPSWYDVDDHDALNRLLDETAMPMPGNGLVPYAAPCTGSGAGRDGPAVTGSGSCRGMIRFGFSAALLVRVDDGGLSLHVPGALGDRLDRAEDMVRCDHGDQRSGVSAGGAG